MLRESASQLRSSRSRVSILPRWRLFCRIQIVDGTYAIQWDTSAPPSRDPLYWCRLLVPVSSSQPIPRPSPHDIMLTFHARLIKILHDWQISRYSVPTLSPLEHKRLASSANAALDIWHDELSLHALDRWWTREVELFWLYSKVTVNAVAAKGLVESREMTVRNASRAMAVEAAMGLLERCTQWSPREGLVNLPNCYFNVSGEVPETLSGWLILGGGWVGR